MRRVGIGWLGILLVAASCASPVASPSSPSSSEGSVPAPATPKRIVAAISGDPNTLSNSVARAGAGGVAGLDALEQMLSAGLSVQDDKGELRAELGEAVPSIENGQW